MPQVPVYDQPAVQQQTLRGGELSAPTDVGAFGGEQAKMLQSIGAGVNTLADSLDRSALMDADAKIKSDYTAWAVEESKKTGAAAVGATERAKQWWNDNAKAYGENLSGRAQKAFFNAAMAQANGSVTHFSAHENQQVQAMEAQNTDAAVTSAVKAAASMPTVQNIDLQKSAIASSLKMYGQNKWTPEVLKEKTEAAVGMMHKAVFDNILADNPTAAKTYFDNNRKEFDPRQYDEITSKLKVHVAEAEGVGAARKYIDQVPKGQYLDREDIEAKLRTDLADKPETLKLAIQEVTRASGVRHEAIASTDAAVLNVINAARAKKPWMTVAEAERMPEWGKLSGTTQQHMKQEMTDRLHMMSLRGQADIERAQLALERKYAPLVFEMAQPRVLANMTENQIRQLMPQIGLHNTEVLLGQFKQYQGNQAALSEATIDNDAFNSKYFKATNVNVFNPGKLSVDDVANAKRVRDMVESSIGNMQQARGGKMSRADKDAEIERIVNAEVVKKNWLGNPGSAKKEIQMKDEDVRAGYVTLGDGKTVPVASVPATELSSLQAKLRAAGMPWSTQDVVRSWHEMKSKPEGKF